MKFFVTFVKENAYFPYSKNSKELYASELESIRESCPRLCPDRVTSTHSADHHMENISLLANIHNLRFVI